MSYLINKLDEIPLNNRIALRTPISIDAEDHAVEHRSIDGSYGMKYAFRAAIGFEGFVTKPEDLHHLRRQARRAVAEAVFGEFRKPLIEIERAAWDRDYDTVKKTVAEIYKAMFEVLE